MIRCDEGARAEEAGGGPVAALRALTSRREESGTKPKCKGSYSKPALNHLLCLYSSSTNRVSVCTGRCKLAARSSQADSSCVCKCSNCGTPSGTHNPALTNSLQP